jgi:hypothetical protein
MEKKPDQMDLAKMGCPEQKRFLAWLELDQRTQ